MKPLLHLVNTLLYMFLCFALFVLSSLLSGCMTRSEVKAHIWLNNGMDPELCAREPVLWNYGFYRKLNNGKLEFISFCDPRSRDWQAIHNRDLEEILDKLLPRKKK